MTDGTHLMQEAHTSHGRDLPHARATNLLQKETLPSGGNTSFRKDATPAGQTHLLRGITTLLRGITTLLRGAGGTCLI